MMTVPSAIMYESVLSANQLRVFKPPTASLGSLITDAQEKPTILSLSNDSCGCFSTDFALVFILLL